MFTNKTHCRDLETNICISNKYNIYDIIFKPLKIGVFRLNCIRLIIISKYLRMYLNIVINIVYGS